MKNSHGQILCFNFAAKSTFLDLADLHEQVLRVKDVDYVSGHVLLCSFPIITID